MVHAPLWTFPFDLDNVPPNASFLPSLISCYEHSKHPSRRGYEGTGLIDRST
jgi:hypothetical protein